MAESGLTYDDILPALGKIAAQVAEWKLYARTLLGGGCGIMVQTENVREKAGDLDLGIIAVTSPGKDAARGGKILHPDRDPAPMFLFNRLQTTEAGKILCGGFSISHDLVRARNGKLDVVEYVEITNRDGHGIKVDLVPWKRIAAGKKEGYERLKELGASFNDQAIYEKTVQDIRRLDSLARFERSRSKSKKPTSAALRPVTFARLDLNLKPKR